MRTQLTALAMAFVLLAGAPGLLKGQSDTSRAGYDQLLDTYVRDGLVYYRALRSDRATLEAFVKAIAGESVDGASKNQQIAFWLNAYNALVLKTVIDQYPISQRSREYPARSIRQIPGAFERVPRRVA